jgi:hypothetical protein
VPPPPWPTPPSSPLEFLIDVQFPPSLEAWFQAKGHEARHVASLSGLDAPDAEIWDRAVTGGYVIVTKDRDFVEWGWRRRGLRVQLLFNPLIPAFAGMSGFFGKAD